MGVVQNMVVLSPKELCTEAMEGSTFRSVWPTAERIVEDKVLCPMPRRALTVSFMTRECAKPFKQQRPSVPPPSTLECEANLELMEIFRSKNSLVNPPNFECSPSPFFPGSPPCRAGNPIVNDAKFVHQRQTTLLGANTESVVHDVEFIHQRQTTLPGANIHAKTIIQDVEFSYKRLVQPSLTIMHMEPDAPAPVCPAIPRVRVEGFDCPGRQFECASHDVRRQVSAFA